MGHSLGGIVIKQVRCVLGTILSLLNLHTGSSETFPGCYLAELLRNIFLEIPHWGLTILLASSTLTTIQAIVELGNDAIIDTYDPNSILQRPSIFPVKGCMFFGVPHKGAEVAETALKFLSMLAPILNINKNKIKDLKPKSQQFANISSEFRSIQLTRNIPVISFYETVKHSHALGLVSHTSILGERHEYGGRNLRTDWQLPITFETLFEYC